MTMGGALPAQGGGRARARAGGLRRGRGALSAAAQEATTRAGCQWCPETFSKLAREGRSLGTSIPVYAPAEHGRYIADTTDGTDQSVQAAILASGYLVEEAPSTSAIAA